MTDKDIETCMQLIEDLKSEESQAKLEAINKLEVAAKILGKDRIKEELIPYLIEIIEERDNQDDFLLAMISQIEVLSKYLSKDDYETLLPPLEILSSMEEVAIRDKAIQVIKNISESQGSNYFNNPYLNMLKRLALWDNYPSRVSACYLFSTCYEALQDNDRVELRQLYSELSHDDTPMVRRAAAVNLKDMINVVEEQYIKAEFLPIYLALVKDDIDSVKVNAIETTPNVMKYYTKQEFKESVIPVLKNVDPDYRSWRVRYALGETLAKVCKDLDGEVVRKQIFPIYDLMLKDSEQEVKSNGIRNVVEILPKLSPDLIQNTFLSTLNLLVMDPAVHVKIALASSITKVAPHVSSEQKLKKLLPLMQALLRDSVIEVKLEVIKNLGGFAKEIGPEATMKHIVPIILNTKNDTLWRCRLTVIEKMPEICESLGYEIFQEELGNFAFETINDHYCLIREQTIENVERFIEIFGYEKVKFKIESMFDKLIENSNYLFRVTALLAIQKLHKSLDQSLFRNLIDRMLLTFSDDKVPNVKFTLVKTLVNLKDALPKDFIKDKVLQALYNLKKDSDVDVQYFARKAQESFTK